MQKCEMVQTQKCEVVKMQKCENSKKNIYFETQKFKSSQNAKFPFMSKQEMLKWSKLKNIKG